MNVTLDERRPYGTIHPPLDGAHYEQDNLFFNVEKKLMVEKLDAAGKEALAKREQRQIAQKAAAVAYRKAMQEAGQHAASLTPEEIARIESSGDIGGDEDQSVDERTEDDIKASAKADIIAWATAGKKIKWVTLKKLYQTAFSFDARDTKNAVEFLVDNKIVTEDAITVAA